MGIQAINPFELPLLNTIILLSSGVTVTYAHHSLIQGIEYTVSSFTISDGTYSSCFYFGTGFHGLHVIIGTAFLAVGFCRLLAYHLTENHQLGFESAILY